MSGLMRAEWKKLIQNKIFCILAAMLILAGAGHAFLSPWYSSAGQPNMLQMEKAYRYFEKNTYNSRIAEEIKKMQSDQYIYSVISMLSSIPLEQAQVYYEMYFAGQDFDIESYQEKYDQGNILRFADTDVKEESILETLNSHVDSLISYPLYLRQITEQAEQIGVSQMQSDEMLHAAQITAGKYQNLHNKTLKFVSPMGIRMAIGTEISDILIVLFGCLMAVFLFSQEKSNHMLSLIATMPKGRKILCRAKICTGLLFCVIFICIIFGFQIISAKIYFGFGDLSRPVQTIPEYIRSPFQLTAGHLLFLVPLLKISCGMLVFLLGAFICINLYEIIACAVMMGIIVGSTGAVRFISEASVLQWIKYWNLASFFQPAYLLGNYIFIRLGRWMLPYTVTVPITILFAGILCIVFSERLWCKRLDCITVGRTKIFRILHRNKVVLGVKPANKKKIASLFYLEGYKLIWAQKAFWVMAAVVILQISVYQSFSIHIDRTEYTLQQRLQVLSGQYTEMKYQSVLEEYEQLNTIQEQIEAYENSMSQKNDRAEFQGADIEYYQMLLRSKDTVDGLMERSEMLKNRALDGKTAYYISDLGYNFLCGKQDLGIRYQPLLIGIVLSLLLSGLFTREWEYGMVPLLQTLPKGEKQVKHVKIVLGLMATLLVWILSWLPEMVYIIRNCALNFIWVAAANLPAFQTLPEWITIWMVMAAVLFVRILYALGIMIIIMYAARGNHSTLGVLFIGSVASVGIGMVMLVYGIY